MIRMKKTILSLCALLACVSVSAQQTANSGPVDHFHTVNLTGGIVAKLVPSDVNSVDVFITDADIKQLKWGVTNGVLSVTFRQPTVKSGKAEVIIQYTDSLKSVSISNGELSFEDLRAARVLNLAVKGGGILSGYVDVLDLVLDVTGNSAASMKGAAKYVTLRVTEKSKADVREVNAASVEADATGGAEAFLTATERLVANAKTGVTIFYTGSPYIVRDRSSKLNSSIGSSVLNIGK